MFVHTETNLCCLLLRQVVNRNMREEQQEEEEEEEEEARALIVIDHAPIHRISGKKQYTEKTPVCAMWWEELRKISGGNLPAHVVLIILVGVLQVCL